MIALAVRCDGNADLALMIRNTDQRSKDYGDIRDKLPAGPCRRRL